MLPTLSQFLNVSIPQILPPVGSSYIFWDILRMLPSVLLFDELA